MNEGYQQYQGMISIGSGKVTGQGLFNGSRVASNSVPFQQSDYIFSVAGEELGLVGCSLIILLLFLLLVKVIHVAHFLPGRPGKVYLLWLFWNHCFAVHFQHWHVPGSAAGDGA